MSLRIGKEIYTSLTAAPLTGGAEGRVHPVVFKTGAVEKPFVTYTCRAVAGPTKDGDAYDTGEVAVSCLADTYEEAVELAVAVRRRMYRIANLFRECALVGSEESYAIDADAYVVVLTFSVRSVPDELE